MITKKEIEKGYSQYEEFRLAKEKFVKELAKFWCAYVDEINKAIANLTKIMVKKNKKEVKNER